MSGAPLTNVDKVEIEKLRKAIRSDKGVIDRRQTAILFANRDIREARQRMCENQRRIEVLGGAVRGWKP
jgi:hypothetical protein